VPIYDYLCSNCAERTEVIHGISDPGPRYCPACGADGTLRKAFAPPAVHFKGSGWAKKDRSSSSGKGRVKPDTPSDSGAAKSGATTDGDSPSPSAPTTKSGGTTAGGSSAATDAPAG
jgi:putative FmdB family regulatory protein